MKKFVAVLMVVIMTLVFASCGEPSPTDQVDAFLQAVKSQDTDAVSALYAGKDFTVTGQTESDDELDALVEEKLMPKLLDFDYELSNEKIDGDKATVDIAFTTYNVGDAITSFMTDYFTQAMSIAFSGGSDEQIDKLGRTLFEKEINELTEKEYTQTVTISLSNTENGWMIDEFEEEGDFYNAITGGVIEASKNLEEAYDFEE